MSGSERSASFDYSDCPARSESNPASEVFRRCFGGKVPPWRQNRAKIAAKAANKDATVREMPPRSYFPVKVSATLHKWHFQLKSAAAAILGDQKYP